MVLSVIIQPVEPSIEDDLRENWRISTSLILGWTFPTGLNNGLSNEREKMNIYVGNLSYDATEDEIRSLFAAHGEVSSVAIIKDKFTGQSRGFAFVEMPNSNEAQTAIQAVNGAPLRNRNLSVNEARPREERPPRSGSGGGGYGDRRGGGGGGGGYGDRRGGSGGRSGDRGGNSGGRRGW